jgi:head-tail adaptor
MILSGEMRYTATFESRVITKNVAGKAVETWVNKFQTRCAINQSKIDAINDDDANLEISVLKIMIRETPIAKLITASQYRVLLDGVYYKINVIDKFKMKRILIIGLLNYD